jgi:hypothetical protein
MLYVFALDEIFHNVTKKVWAETLIRPERPVAALAPSHRTPQRGQ